MNELSCPVHVIGAPGLIVAAGADGILVAGIEQAKRIKQKLEGHAAKPMIEEKRWGAHAFWISHEQQQELRLRLPKSRCWQGSTPAIIFTGIPKKYGLFFRGMESTV